MPNNITRLILLLVSLFSLCAILTYKLLGMKAFFVSVFFVVIYAFFSKNILMYTTESCVEHIHGKKIFQLEFPFFYNIFNPSIVKIPSGYLCCIRCSTLTQKNILYYLYGHFFYDSFILFVEIDNCGNYKIIYPEHTKLKGHLEDPRIIKYEDKYILSTSEYISGENNFPVLLTYDKNYNFTKRIDYNRSDYFGKDKMIGIQKNWCLFEHEGDVYVHTDVYPKWKIFRLDIETGNMIKIVDTEYSFPIKYYLRCSTSWKIYNENYYICGIHTKTKEKMPTIRSILVLIDRKTLTPAFRTNLLCLEPNVHNRTQFLCGLETDEFYIILSYGLNDSEIALKKIAKYRLKFIPYNFS